MVGKRRRVWRNLMVAAVLMTGSPANANDRALYAAYCEQVAVELYNKFSAIMVGQCTHHAVVRQSVEIHSCPITVALNQPIGLPLRPRPREQQSPNFCSHHLA